MKITRDVIYDLLPAYFAGEVSADTRALIDEFLTTDPEFARMTARFQRLFDERGAVDAGDVAAERDRLERPRSRAERRQMSGAFAVAYTLAAIFPLAVDLLRGQPVPGQVARDLDRLRRCRVRLDDRMAHIKTGGFHLDAEP